VSTVGRLLLASLLGLAVAWAGLLTLIAVRRPHGQTLAELLRLLPDLLRLIAGLAKDRTLPKGVRWRLALLAAYLASPVDLVPDVIPVIGYADDAIVVALTLRAVARRAGPEAIARHWPGTPDGLAILTAVLHLPTATRMPD
jgi:uncharacterized membrane protein YkvA (DUF1232 family)